MDGREETTGMNVVIPDDYQDAVRTLRCFAKLAGHAVTIYRDTVKDTDSLAERFRDADALVLIRERTRSTTLFSNGCRGSG